MNTFVNQSLIDSGDPLALSMMSQGAKSFKLVPVVEWEYKIYEVIYWLGQSEITMVKKGYLLSTDNHIENGVDDFFPSNSRWVTWEAKEDVKGKVPFKTTCNGLQSYGHGLYCSMEELKSDYKIKEN